MNFRTEIHIPSADFKISHQDKISMIGSCFVENISAKLEGAGFHIDVNPFGIVYNPVSVGDTLIKILQKKNFSAEDFFFHQGLYHSFSHHSRFSCPDPEKMAEDINRQIEQSFQFISDSNYLFITLGTANVYYLSDKNTPVANCHKLPTKTFYNKRLRVEDIVENWHFVFSLLRKINPDIKTIFTVSPIRHWKDGAHENQISKSILFVAIDQLIQSIPNTFYFPSYELLIDELRDYRFYAEDMLHPSCQAIEYIWNKFSDTYFSGHTKSLIKEWINIQQAFNHKPFNPDLEEYHIFRQKTEKREAEFLQKNPDFKREVK